MSQGLCAIKSKEILISLSKSMKQLQSQRYASKTFVSNLEDYMQQILHLKHDLGPNPYKDKEYCTVIRDMMNTMNTSPSQKSEDFCKLLKKNRNISLLLNEIDPSLNPFMLEMDFSMRYLEYYNKKYSHRRKFKWAAGGTILSITILYLLYFRISFYMEHSFDLFRPNMRTLIHRFK
ncbi:unnamed protein product [Moneuplotes crassus]|uniref:Uncharacterized protein n=1 Tax=Euplotes crassus TaxID=5936 RepID=A0AAD1Y0N0_EUPCR|nr:unnamed protein product [Moneuplotes crassus]